MRIDKKILAWTAVLALLPFLVSAQLAQPKAWTADKIQEVLTLIANFLIVIGIIGAVITIVTAGIVYFASGFNANAVAKAKGLFRSALIGTLLIVGAGVIINTIGVIITGEFFGVVGPPGVGGGQGIGGSCESVDDCGEDLLCRKKDNKSKTGMCVRKYGGLKGEPCFDKGDCASGLACDFKLISQGSGQTKGAGTCN